MKKKNRKLTILIVLFFIIIACTTGCGKKEKTYAEKKKEQRQNIASQRVEKMYSVKKEDGWYYYFMITFLGNNIDKMYTFNGCNLKYSSLTDYNVLVVDDSGNIIDRIPTQPTLAVSEKSINGIMEREDIPTINKYFNTMQFNNKITLEDIQTLEVNNFSKEEIISLFNSVQDVEYRKEFGKYDLPDCSVYTENTTETPKFQIGTLMSWGNFEALEIDMDYGDGVYLSDKIAKGNATIEEKNLYDNLQKIEKYILESQNIDIATKFSNFKGKQYDRLFTFIKSLGNMQ